jgi:hypothetical protein
MKTPQVPAIPGMTPLGITPAVQKRHGGAWDRGSADSYYRRGAKPHYYKGATYSSEIVTEESMTAEEIAAYYAGYEWNEKLGDFKNWD